MEFGMSRRIKPKDEVWHNLDGPSKNKELWSYVVSFELSRLKVASFICTIPHTTAFVNQVHWLEQEIAQWVHHEGSI